jgi:primosomal replication protein N
MVEPAAEYLRSFEEEDEHDEHFALHAHRQGRRAVPRHGAQLMRVFGDITADAAETLRTLVSGQEGLEVQRRAPARSSVPHPQSLDLELALRSRLVAAGFEHHVRLQHPRTGDGFEYDFWQASDGIAIEVMGYRADEEIYKDILKFHVHQGTHVGVVPRPGHVVSRTCARLRGDGA